MNTVTLLLLTTSVVCSTARAVFSKKLNAAPSGSSGFYQTQGLLFMVAAAICLINLRSIGRPCGITVVLAVVYGLFTVTSQWMYTAALSKAPVSICAMVYSFGFIVPTVFGTVVCRESVNGWKIISILLCLCTILLTSLKEGEARPKLSGLPVSLIIAMLASGGLGVVQKIQQKTAASEETGTFLLLAFVLAALLSWAAALLKCRQGEPPLRLTPSLALNIGLVGVSMAIANTVNTLLAGRLPSAVVFPIVNVGVILASLLVSILLLKEKIGKRQILAFLLGVTAILLFNI